MRHVVHTTIHHAAVLLLLAACGPEGDDRTAPRAEAGATDGAVRQEAPAAPVPSPAPRPTPAADAAVSLPDFAAIEDIPTLKRAFFGYLSPIVTAENDRIRVQRRRLLRLHDRRADGGRLTPTDRAWIANLARRYELPIETPGPVPVAHLEHLLRRVDILPRELALAQAAIESGWGRSRFATLGNNIYGHWCYEPGCGIVPAGRPEGARHEVADFESPAQSVRAYLRNLNTHAPYAGLRLLRERQRRESDRLDARALAGQLQNYSTLRDEYVRRVRAVMRQNRDLLAGVPTPSTAAAKASP